MRNTLPILMLTLGLTFAAYAQKPATAPAADPAQRYILKKQVFVDETDSQLSSVQYAAVRVKVRYELAKWLWKGGKDDTGRAEGLAVKAVDDLYEKIAEIENPQFLSGPLFALLEQNAKAAAAKLKAKHYKDSGDDLTNAFDLLNKPGGDKLVADKVLKYLSGKANFDSNITFILRELREMRSPQFPIILAAILQSAEAGRVNLDSSSLRFLVSDFSDQAAPVGLVPRYVDLVFARARTAVQMQNMESQSLLYLLREITRTMGEKIPDMLAEAEGLIAALASRTSQAENRKREAEDRIQASEDKLSALIDEAEKATVLSDKNSFYVRAQITAFEAAKYQIAINILSTLRDLNKDDKFYSNLWTDQELAIINKEALQKDEVEVAENARVLIGDEVRRGEAWKEAALYFAGKKNRIDADDSLTKSIKLLTEADRENLQRIHALIRLIPAVQKVDKQRLQEAIVFSAKAINDLPAPGPDDKPGTDDYKSYVRTVMGMNVNVTSAMGSLFKENRSAAIEFGERIQKREVRVLVDLLIGIDALESSQKTAGRRPR